MGGWGWGRGDGEISGKVDARGAVGGCGRSHHGRVSGRTGGVSRVDPAGQAPPVGGAPDAPRAWPPGFQPADLLRAGGRVAPKSLSVGCRRLWSEREPRRPDPSGVPLPPRASGELVLRWVLHPSPSHPSPAYGTSLGSFSIDFLEQRFPRKKPGGGGGGCFPASLRRPGSLPSQRLRKPSLCWQPDPNPPRWGSEVPAASRRSVSDPSPPQRLPARTTCLELHARPVGWRVGPSAALSFPFPVLGPACQPLPLPCPPDPSGNRFPYAPCPSRGWLTISPIVSRTIQYRLWLGAFRGCPLPDRTGPVSL